MGTTPSAASQRDAVTNALVRTTRIVSHLSSHDLNFERSISSSVSTALNTRADRLLGLARGLTAAASVDTAIPGPALSGLDDLELSWRGVVDVLDHLLEQVDTSLDEYGGRRRAQTQESTASTKPVNESKKQKKSEVPRLLNIPKPQSQFDEKADNVGAPPWKPLLKGKPHAQISLDQSLITNSNDDGVRQYRHPYQHELAHYQYPEWVYQHADPQPYQPFEGTEAIWVDTPEGVQLMLDELKESREIAIDLEHHDLRSYYGLVSLMQISTRNKDWVVDTLVPWRQNLQVLNEVFADPAILKVFHGAFMDIVWLQRDLGLYIVGLWDTYDCTRVLGYPGHSLAYLLKRFVDFDADKQYQLADWRARPLTPEMMKYARADTHFLLYIYDNLRNSLFEPASLEMTGRQRVDAVMDASRETSLKRFETWSYQSETGTGPMGWRNAFERMSGDLSGIQVAVYKGLHRWRDQIARAEDEGLQQVMPQRMLMNLANAMPTDKRSFFMIARPATEIMYKEVDMICKVIKEAKLGGIDGPSLRDLQKGWRLDYMAEAGLSVQGVGTIASLIDSKVDVPSEPAQPVPPTPPAPSAPISSDASRRATESQLWGSTSMQFTSRTLPSIAALLSMPMMVPGIDLPNTPEGQDTEMVMEQPPSVIMSSNGAIVPATDTQQQAGENLDEILILKELSSKRKRKHQLVSGGAELDDAPHQNGRRRECSDDGILERKDAEREKKRKRKQLQKEKAMHRQQGTEAGAASGLVQEEVVDYENASESILRPRVHRPDTNGTSGRAKVVDPSDQGPKPAPNRRRAEQRGKSVTFKV